MDKKSQSAPCSRCLLANNGDKSCISPCLGGERRREERAEPPRPPSALHRSPFSKCFLFNYDLFPLPRPPAPASVKGALLSLVTGSRARPLASSLWEEPAAGGSQAVRPGCREPQNGSAPSGDVADEPGFPRRLGARPLVPAGCGDPEAPRRAAPRRGTDARTARWLARTREDRGGG